MCVHVSNQNYRSSYRSRIDGDRRTFRCKVHLTLVPSGTGSWFRHILLLIGPFPIAVIVGRGLFVRCGDGFRFEGGTVSGAD